MSEETLEHEIKYMAAIKFITIGLVLSIICAYISLEFLAAVYPNNMVLICIIFSLLFGFGASGYYVYKYKGQRSENT